MCLHEHQGLDVCVCVVRSEPQRLLCLEYGVGTFALMNDRTAETVSAGTTVLFTATVYVSVGRPWESVAWARDTPTEDALIFSAERI